MARVEEVKGKPQGRRKISIEKIVDKGKTQVTFSKRRKGIFKKASELCSLCNAKIAVLTFSGAGKVFSFGHPNADEIVDTYLHGATLLVTEDSSENTNEELSEEKINVTTYRDDVFWWEKSIEGLGLDELEQYMASLQELRNKVASKVVNEKKNVSHLSFNPQFGLDLNEAYIPLGNDHIHTMGF